MGFSQPFFQCSPPLLSATWFGARERATATATALNANQLGIAAAFVVGGLVVGDDASKLPAYFMDISLASGAATLLTCCFFRGRPPTPPTASAARAVEALRSADSADEPRALGLRYPVILSQLVRIEGFNPSRGRAERPPGVATPPRRRDGSRRRRRGNRSLGPASTLAKISTACSGTHVITAARNANARAGRWPRSSVPSE